MQHGHYFTMKLFFPPMIGKIFTSSYNDLKYDKPICPNAEKIQPKIMQFITNLGSLEEAEIEINALKKTINYFKSK